MPFEVQLQDKNFDNIAFPAGVTVKVIRYSEKAVGGYAEAEIEIFGSDEALAQSLNWLRYGIVIKNKSGTVVWSGYVEGVDIIAGALWDRVSLQAMWNKVAVTYSYNAANGDWIRGTTAYSSDSDSISRYGTKENVFSMGDGESALAIAKRDEIVRQQGKPTALPIVDSAERGVRLYCRGLWNTLNWKYFQRLEGKIENEGTNSEFAFPLGWKVAASQQIGFLGTTTTYTRSVTSATNATPIVITTSTAHSLSSGDIVTISGVGGNTAANGTFKVASATATTFQLTNSGTGADIAGNGAYTSGGTVTVAISNPSNSKIVYGKPITGVTNATPIVITCTSHGFSNGNLVKISDIEGNSAANGEFVVKNATTNTFELTDKTTGANIAGTGDYATGGWVVLSSADGVFSKLISGQTLIISGSASNNTSFTTIANGSSNGNEIDIASVPTTEFAGASTTIQLTGEQVAQSFIGTTGFSAKYIALKLGKFGNPADSVSVQLRNDSSGNVGATVYASGTVSNSLLSESPDWVWITLNETIALTDATRYWLVIYRTSTASAINHYLLQLDSSTYETLKLWNGSAWTSGTAGQCVPFKVWATEDTASQINRMLTDSNQFFTTIDTPVSHGVTSNPYRVGDRRALNEIEDLLATTGSNGRRLLARVDKDRSIKVFAEPVATESDNLLTKNKEVKAASGQYWEVGVLPVGKWLIRDGLPAGTDIMIQRSVFVEEAVFDANSETISQLRLRGSEEFFI